MPAHSNGPTLEWPPITANAEGQTRRVGLEIEFSGIDLAAAAATLPGTPRSNARRAASLLRSAARARARDAWFLEKEGIGTLSDLYMGMRIVFNDPGSLV